MKRPNSISSDCDTLRTLAVYTREFNDSFQYQFVDPKTLTEKEKAVWEMTTQILGLVGLEKDKPIEVKISTAMRITSDSTEGVWDPQIGAIVINRAVLRSFPGYAGVLLHEETHAVSGTPDVTQAFEHQLTTFLGYVAVRALGVR